MLDCLVTHSSGFTIVYCDDLIDEYKDRLASNHQQTSMLGHYSHITPLTCFTYINLMIVCLLTSHVLFVLSLW